MSFVSFHVIRLVAIATITVFFAGAANAQASCEKNFRDYDDVTKAIEESLRCMANKIDDLEKDAGPRLDELGDQINLADDTIIRARLVAKEAKAEADEARNVSGRADAIVTDLEAKIATAAEIVALLEGVEDLEGFLSNNTEFQQKIANLVVSVPTGTVAAFDLEQCPVGWRTFDEAAGRVLVGVGTGANLTQRELRDTDGAETHTLKDDQVPKHKHGPEVGTDFWVYDSNGVERNELPIIPRDKSGVVRTIRSTDEKGGGQPPQQHATVHRAHLLQEVRAGTDYRSRDETVCC